jgi:hypothetical protein
VASLHQRHRGLQHHPLESACVPSSFAVLHVQVSSEDSNRWLDVTGWDPSMRNRYGQNTGYCAAFDSTTFVYDDDKSTHLKLLFEFAGSEAMYADLGHFSQSSIKVRDECLSLKFHFIVLCH